MENMTELNKTGEANPGLAVHHSDFMLEWIFQVASPSADSFRAWAQCSLGKCTKGGSLHTLSKVPIMQ